MQLYGTPASSIESSCLKSNFYADLSYYWTSHSFLSSPFFISFILSFFHFLISPPFSLYFFSNRVSEGLRVCLRKNTCSMAVCTGKELRLGKWKLYNWDNGQRGREKGRKDVQDRVHQSRLNRNLETERRSKLMLIYYKLP